jgi:acyl carrier protein
MVLRLGRIRIYGLRFDVSTVLRFSFLQEGALLSNCTSANGLREFARSYNLGNSMPTTPTIEQTVERVLALASSHFKVPRAELSPDDDFFKKLGISSLQVLDLLTRVESHFGIELPDYELQGVSDFRTLAQRIQARL